MIPEGFPYIFTTLLTLIAIFITDYRLGIAFILTIPITMLCLSLSEPLIKVIGFMPSIPMLSYGINKIEDVFKYPDVKNGLYSNLWQKRVQSKSWKIKK